MIHIELQKGVFVVVGSAYFPGPMLVGKKAVVTGGSQGIGAAIVRAFASHGASVLVVDTAPLGEVEFDSAAGGSINHLEYDVRAQEVPVALTEFAPDVLVNNVGHFLNPPTAFTGTDPGFWSEAGNINFDHVVRLTHALLPGMIDRGVGGSIVNLTTVEAHRAIPGHTMYSAYKAALTQFTRSLGVEIGRTGVRVNAIAPDLIESVQVPYRRIVPADDWDKWPGWAPLGGPGQPVDIAGPALFLASDLARYITGTVIHVDGGSHAAGGWFPTEEGGWTNRPRKA
ncbi:SDR family NAD(P)-dependent oxidoreductase [Rhodococcus erythropolis]|uniref:SDR family NAD(P)-dependent oxidoreductase n=1 Tax=Rhodococcus TaxID=1827 RepID=UPI000BE2FAFF|nr:MULTISPECIES: SDR family NAD(P)-dependent oxidoreductase [Rhodococcus]ATI32158.1 oxidoreductase [Rhodococcus sp. H-CA8f]MDV6209253.1 SDR family NAD(P)-dependent oxidoreductase [Rhodococcus erythropolis]